MIRTGAFTTIVLFILAATAFAQPEQPNFTREEVQPSPQTRGALYTPTGQPAPHVAVLMMHRTADFRNHIATRELARRGFVVLAMNSRFEGDESAVNWEELPLDAKAGVELLKKQPGVTKVVLFCHSGGGSLLGFYQALAENGPGYSQGPNKISQGSDRLAGLPRADGVIFVDAHPGIAVNMLRGLNPAVTDEDKPEQLDPALDSTNPANGFRSGVPSEYTAEFKQRYITGQAERMGRLIKRAQQQLESAKSAGIDAPEKQAFAVAGGGGVRLSELFADLGAGTQQPQQFLKNDGTMVKQVVTRVRPRAIEPAAGQRRGERGAGGGRAGGGRQGGRGRSMTLQSFLTANSVRATDSLDNIDWCSTNSTTPCAAAAISAPVLVTAMGGHSFIRDGEVIFDATKSTDKEFVIIEGATHNIEPCTACEETPGQYSNVTKNHFDYLAKWIKARF